MRIAKSENIAPAAFIDHIFPNPGSTLGKCDPAMRKVAATLRPSLIAAIAAFIFPFPVESAEIDNRPLAKPAPGGWSNGRADRKNFGEPKADTDLPLLAQGEAVPQADGARTEGGDLAPSFASKRLAELKIPRKTACPLNGGDAPILAAIPPSPTAGGLCVVAEPVQLQTIGAGGSIALAGGLLLDCDFTLQVETFIADTLADTALIQLGSRLAGVTVSASYLCPAGELPPKGEGEPEVVGSTATLNAPTDAATPGGEISAAMRQHAAGRAIDIAALTFSDGRVISVADAWGKDTIEGRFLQVVHAKACREFSTVLGPGAGESGLAEREALEVGAAAGGAEEPATAGSLAEATGAVASVAFHDAPGAAALHLDNACAGEGCPARICN